MECCGRQQQQHAARISTPLPDFRGKVNIAFSVCTSKDARSFTASLCFFSQVIFMPQCLSHLVTYRLSCRSLYKGKERSALMARPSPSGMWGLISAFSRMASLVSLFVCSILCASCLSAPFCPPDMVLHMLESATDLRPLVLATTSCDAFLAFVTRTAEGT